MERYFTLEEANHALALVSPIVSDIVAKMNQAKRIHEEVKTERERELISEVELLMKLRTAEKLLNEVEYHMKELESVGAMLKDLTLGLVDFPCLHDARVVYLCWMLGEKTVNAWHETDRGYTERKPVDESFWMVAKV